MGQRIQAAPGITIQCSRPPVAAGAEWATSSPKSLTTAQAWRSAASVVAPATATGPRASGRAEAVASGVPPALPPPPAACLRLSDDLPWCALSPESAWYTPASGRFLVCKRPQFCFFTPNWRHRSDIDQSNRNKVLLDPVEPLRCATRTPNENFVHHRKPDSFAADRAAPGLRQRAAGRRCISPPAPSPPHGRMCNRRRPSL
jgi:hypothetical protein